MLSWWQNTQIWKLPSLHWQFGAKSAKASPFGLTLWQNSTKALWAFALRQRFNGSGNPSSWHRKTLVEHVNRSFNQYVTGKQPNKSYQFSVNGIPNFISSSFLVKTLGPTLSIANTKMTKLQTFHFCQIVCEVYLQQQLSPLNPTLSRESEMVLHISAYFTKWNTGEFSYDLKIPRMLLANHY